MSLRSLLGLGRRLLQKKTEQVTPETIRTSTVSGIPEIPTSLRSQTKALTPQTVAEQSKALTVTEPLVKGPPLINPMINLPKTVVNTGGAPGGVQTFEQRPLFGSTAYDRIAQKGDGMFTADEWANWLTDRGKRNFKLFGRDFEEGYISGAKFKYDTGLAKSSHLLNKEQQVSLEELFDANIATFDRQGNLTGGLLGAAKDSGIKLPGQMLADMARLNPANRIKVIEKAQKEGIGNRNLRALTKAVKSSPQEVKDALFSDEITTEQAERISKLKDESSRKIAIAEHKSIKMIDKGIEKNIEMRISASQKNKLDKQLLQANNWIKSFRNSVSDSRTQLKKTIQVLLVATKFIPLMDTIQKEKLDEEILRFNEILDKASQLAEQIKDKNNE